MNYNLIKILVKTLKISFKNFFNEMKMIDIQLNKLLIINGFNKNIMSKIR